MYMQCANIAKCMMIYKTKTTIIALLLPEVVYDEHWTLTMHDSICVVVWHTIICQTTTKEKYQKSGFTKIYNS